MHSLKFNHLVSIKTMVMLGNVSSDLLDAIKAAYKSKPITIIVEEEEDLSQEMKIILDNRLQEDESTYITSKQSVDMLKKNYVLNR